MHWEYLDWKTLEKLSPIRLSQAQPKTQKLQHVDMLVSYQPLDAFLPEHLY